MSDLPLLITTWPSVLTILLILFVAALVGPGRRSSSVPSPEDTSPVVDLSLWPASEAHPMGESQFPRDRWARYYDQQFAERTRHLRN